MNVMGKTYSNMAICDLRQISVEEAAVIEAIRDIAILILPSDGDPAVMAALASAEISNVAQTVRISKSAGFLNGVVHLDSSYFREGETASYYINGVVHITEVPVSGKVILDINGIALFDENLRGKCSGIQISSLNGMKVYADAAHFKDVSAEIMLDSDFLRYVEPNTMFITVGKLTVGDDVTPEMLEEKKVSFFIVGSLSCRQEIVPYFRAKVKILGEIEQ